jgi:protein phosphatase
VESFRDGLAGTPLPEDALAARAREANARIYELSHSDAEHAGMGTTLTAVYVGEQDVAIAHVGDSRAYCMREGELLRLTDDHSLVDELMRQGRLTAEEAIEHPQRSVITRALGPESTVEVDTRSYRAQPGDVYLLCSDGLTTMVPEEEVAAVLLSHPRLRDAGEALIAAANEAGGRDNITVVLLRLEEVPVPGAWPGHQGGASAAAPVRAAPVRRRRPRPPTPRDPVSDSAADAHGLGRLRRAGAVAIVLVVVGLVGTAAYVASQSVYFIGTNNRGLVTLYRGLPYRLPGDVPLYSSDFVSGVSASTLSPQRRRSLLDHSLRSEGNATSLMRSLELGQLE